jgi:DNA-binding MarR family transcriptional regulator
VGGVTPPADHAPSADGPPLAGSPPLARLFAIGYRQLIDSLHDRLQARGWTDVRPAFGFVLLAARDQPTSVTELAGLMGMTKQAASKLVDAMVSGGYLQRGTDAQDGRQRPVTLTSRGEDLLSAVEEIYAELEAGWATLIGTSHLDRMRQDLIKVLADPANGQLPPVRPSW